MSFNPKRVIIARLTPEWSVDLATKKKAVGIRDRSLLPQARDGSFKIDTVYTGKTQADAKLLVSKAACDFVK